MKKNKILMLLLALVLCSSLASAQCKQQNTAFQGGEYLYYNLYFNWKMVWVKAGTASYSTVQSVRNGRPAYRACLTTTTNKKADGMFVMRDTLLSYTSLDLEPLYYRKGAQENDRYTVDEVFYKYSGGKTNLRLHRQHHGGNHTWQNQSSTQCVYDMFSVLLRSRSFDFTSWTKGKEITLPIATGKTLTTAKVQYKGKTTMKADNGKKYNCVILSYVEKRDGKFKETLRFYVTDDKNHIPVRIDFYLKFGSAKAYLTSMKGMKNPVAALAK